MVDSQFRTFVECIEEQGLITDDILFEGIAEELQTISPIFAEPRWVTIDGNEGLETFVQDADGCGGNIILATAKLFFGRETVGSVIPRKVPRSTVLHLHHRKSSPCRRRAYPGG